MSNIEELANGVSKLKAEAKRIAATNDAHEQEILKKEARIKDLEAEESAIEKSISGLQSDSAELHLSLRKKDQELADLNAEIYLKKNELESTLFKIDEAIAKENERLKAENKELKKEGEKRRSSVVALGKEQSKLKQYFSKVSDAING